MCTPRDADPRRAQAEENARTRATASYSSAGSRRRLAGARTAARASGTSCDHRDAGACRPRSRILAAMTPGALGDDAGRAARRVVLQRDGDVGRVDQHDVGGGDVGHHPVAAHRAAAGRGCAPFICGSPSDCLCSSLISCLAHPQLLVEPAPLHQRSRRRRGPGRAMAATRRISSAPRLRPRRRRPRSATRAAGRDQLAGDAAHGRLVGDAAEHGELEQRPCQAPRRRARRTCRLSPCAG